VVVEAGALVAILAADVRGTRRRALRRVPYPRVVVAGASVMNARKRSEAIDRHVAATMPRRPDVATCIKCWCDDRNACQLPNGGACSWLTVDRDAGVGVCSGCADVLPLWNAGCRQLLLPPSRVARLLKKVALGGSHGR